MKKILSIVLLLSMMLSAFSGCSDTINEEAGTTEPSAEADIAETVETEPETMYLPDDLPDDLTYNGTTVTTFGWSGPANAEFYVEEMNGEIVNDAIFERNATVSERLDVVLEYTLVPGANPDRASWVNNISNSITAGDGAYDIAAGYSMAGASLAAKSMLIDLNTLAHIDFTKPWWPSSLQDEATVAGKLYFCSGDISTYMIYYLYGMYFNKQLITDYSLENPYNLVKEGTWTLDKLISMANGIYVDANGNGTKDLGDIYGFETHSTYVDPFYFGSGLRTTTVGEDGLPVLSDDFGSEKTHDVLVKLVEFFATNDAYLETSSYDNANNLFKEGRAIFIDHEFTLAINHLRNTEMEYGIVPIPKYDEVQQEYYTVMSFPYSLYGVPIDAKNPDMSAAVIECLGSESYRQVSPALFETGFKVKYASDNESAEMFDIIRESVVFDFGRIFNDNFSSKTYSLFRSAVVSGDTNWASIYNSNAKALSKMIAKVVETLAGE